MQQALKTINCAPSNLARRPVGPTQTPARAFALSPSEASEIKHLFFQFLANDEFIREGQKQRFADLTAEHRRALVRLRNAVWQIARETRLLERIYSSRGENSAPAANNGAQLQQRNANASADDCLPRTVVIQSARNTGFDVALTVESRTKENNHAAEKSAVRENPTLPATSLPATSLPATNLPATSLPAANAPADLGSAPCELTGRQRDVLSLMIRGMSNKEIARALGLAEGTVKVHVSALFNKLGTHHRTAAAVIGAQLLSHMH